MTGVHYLIDTSILMRFANSSDADHVLAAFAIRTLYDRVEVLHVAPQNLIEFRSSSTRPVEVNGLGLSAEVVDNRIAAFERVFPLLPETPEIYPAWKNLVKAAAIVGKQVHDARLAAVCQVHGVTHIFTFNARHFARFVPDVSGLNIVDPVSICMGGR